MPPTRPSESISLIQPVVSVGNCGISAAYELFFCLDFSRESFRLGRDPHDVQQDFDTGDQVRIGSKVHP